MGLLLLDENHRMPDASIVTASRIFLIGITEFFFKYLVIFIQLL